MTDTKGQHPPRLSILGAHVIDPASRFDQVADLHLADGRVLAIGQKPADFQPEELIDASGLLAIPGLVDLCARLRQPGLEQKATIRSETRAAASAGITTLCCPPDTLPVVDTPAVAQLIRQTAEQHGFARVLPAGSLTQDLAGEQISEMAALARAGCPVLSHADRPIRSARVQRRALEYAATFDLTCFLHPANASLSEGGLVHEGRISTRLGLPGIPAAAETVAVARDLALAEQTGARIHFRGLSTARATEMLAEARARGVQVTADVSAHQLFLTEDDIGTFDANALVLPPLRTEADRQALRAAVASGVISAICSDHQPHEADAKLDTFPQAAPGISALETLLPLTLRLADEGLLPMTSALACVTCHAADILGLPHGRLQPGAPADLCLLAPNEHWTLTAERMHSQGKNTPFLGQSMHGAVRLTLLGGQPAFDAAGP
ncbi:dihydroorotase [Thiorhodovibrio frisius]|uniref:Dihydroorotase, multifunctional complex type n=1 Tax=Thiorhodovibrio frisius TaxID=631362 RepID=H8Z3M2_9GAMM|nr:dihydroorotase [Thiorhodovibrio frisius]EIC20011.1 dihydroorotase, multifunctional complex type [Thiorhodovibrio frisius]WPL20740.1 Dihydroorotase [Thiorhodovibrio frisius]